MMTLSETNADQSTMHMEPATAPRDAVPFVQVDAFTSTPFCGNPAAVCLLPRTRDAEWMQRVAREMNLADTAFVLPQGDGFALRWFTPTTEVALCGHATLAAAHALWEAGRQGPHDRIRFHTASGLLTAVRNGEWIELDFPATPDEAVDTPVELVEALGAAPVYVGKSRFDYLVQFDTEDAVLRLRPDFARLKTVAARGIIATSRSAGPDDFVSRFFAPASGIDEDPVTGSAHCCLGPFWSRRLGKQTLLARQVSARGGVVRVHVDGERVRLEGQAVTMMRGELYA
jgi:PhzF family phenazine biosynthesis protein